MKSKFSTPLSVVLFLVAASAAQAHPAAAQVVGVASGFFHPLSGWDHLLAIVAIGLWAAQLCGRASWRVATVFVSVMALSAVAGHFTGVVPGIDPGIAASVLVLGLLLATATRVPPAASVTLAAIFAGFHGFAHGAEMPAATGGLAYGAGFLAATALLLAAGVGLGFGTARISESIPRLMGWVIAGAGAALVAS
jgi:urease accessory protein